MHDAPSPSELIAAVKSFIDDAAAPQLTGHAAFHARVASNVLATLLRELEQRPSAERGEFERLRSILGAPQDATLDGMNRDLCERIRDGRIDAATPGLFKHCFPHSTIAPMTVGLSCLRKFLRLSGKTDGLLMSY